MRMPLAGPALRASQSQQINKGGGEGHQRGSSPSPPSDDASRGDGGLPGRRPYRERTGPSEGSRPSGRHESGEPAIHTQ